jgi:enoyl-CoA hydratase
MGVPELLVGVPFPTIALEIMRFATSSQNLQKLLYGGETFLPEEAAAMSLVDELAEPEDLLALATGMAEKLSRVSSKNFAITKRQIRQPVLDQVGKGESTFEPEIQGIWGSPETVEAMRSYVSRTLSKG